MAQSRIARTARRVRVSASGGIPSPARWPALATLLVVVLLLSGMSGVAQQGTPQASPMASPGATPMATPATATGPANVVIVGSITIGITNDGLVPDHFESAVGRDVTITVENQSDQAQVFTLEAFDIQMELAPGTSDTVDIDLPRLGTYPYSTEGEDGTVFEGTMTIFI